MTDTANDTADARVTDLSEIAPQFVAMAHTIVWCSVATVDPRGRPWSRILHPIWEWDGTQLTGWIATGKTPIKAQHLAQHPYVSCNYWTPHQDTCVAECTASWVEDAAGKAAVWDKLAQGPQPVGYDPAMIPGWDSPASPTFSALRLEPWRLRVMPAAAMLSGVGILRWFAPAESGR